MGLVEILTKYWEWIVMFFLVADIVVQKTPWKRDDDILAMIKSTIGKIFTSKPGKLPMLFLAFLLVPMLALASDVTFEWDSNSENDMAYYNVYRSADQTNWIRVNPAPILHTGAGTETWTECGVSDGAWYWYATANDTGGNESDPSNIVTATVDATAPAPPQNFFVSLILKIIAWIKGLFSGSFALA